MLEVVESSAGLAPSVEVSVTVLQMVDHGVYRWIRVAARPAMCGGNATSTQPPGWSIQVTKNILQSVVLCSEGGVLELQFQTEEPRVELAGVLAVKLAGGGDAALRVNRSL